MTTPSNSVTTEDGRYYTWPKYPGVHFPSITTIIKQGVPKPFLAKWTAKKAAEKAWEDAHIIVALKEMTSGN